MVSASVILVCVLYMLLLHDLLHHLWIKMAGGSEISTKQASLYRPKLSTPSPVITSPTGGTVSSGSSNSGPKSLDALWRRMKIACRHGHSMGVNHETITRAMADARKQQQCLEQARLAEAFMLEYGLADTYAAAMTK